MSQSPMAALTAAAIPGTIAPGDHQGAAEAVEGVPSGANLRVLQCLVEKRFHFVGALLAGDPEERAVSDHRASAPASMTSSSAQDFLCGERRSRDSVSSRRGRSNNSRISNCTRRNTTRRPIAPARLRATRRRLPGPGSPGERRSPPGGQRIHEDPVSSPERLASRSTAIVPPSVLIEAVSACDRARPDGRRAGAGGRDRSDGCLHACARA